MFRPVSRIVRNKGTKVRSLGGALAVGLARKRRDPAYARLQKLKALWKQQKAMIMRRYGNKGNMLARKAAQARKR